MTLNVYVSRDAAAVALGADDTAAALQRAAEATGQPIRIVRTGSRGMVWLEPLVEVEVDGQRVGYGPISADDVPALVGAGLFSSTLTNNQIIAAVVSLSVFLLLWIIDEVAPLLPSPLNDVVLHLSLSGHFKPFATGSLYLSDVAFFLSAAFLTLFLSIRALSWR